jgi:hypothetical protein
LHEKLPEPGLHKNPWGVLFDEEPLPAFLTWIDHTFSCGRFTLRSIKSGLTMTKSLGRLTRAQVYECLAYYEDHRGEIDALVAEQMADDLK